MRLRDAATPVLASRATFDTVLRAAFAAFATLDLVLLRFSARTCAAAVR